MSNDATITAEDLLVHRGWLERLARRLADPASAEDLVQETWATAVRTQPDRGRPLGPWLGEVLRNLARMRARGRSRWQARVDKVAAGEAPLPTPEELLTYHEAQRLVAEEVARLEEPYRSTVLLCYAQEVAPAEIARRQGIPAGTVRWRLKRGLDDVRAALDARYGQDREAWRRVLAPLVVARGWRGGGAAAPGLLGGAGRLVTPLALGAVPLLVLGWQLARAPERTPPEPVALPRLRAPGSSVPRLALAPGEAPLPPAPPPSQPGGPPPPPNEAEVAAALRRAAEPGDSPARGNPRAPVTVVIWSEFQCPFCARALPTLHELEAAYPDQLRLVWKHLPLAFHESAFLASEAALFAHEHGKFWPMHDRLLAHHVELDLPALEDHVEALGLSRAGFRAALESGRYRKRVEADVALAKAAGIGGAPTFLINGERLDGAQPLPAFQRLVDAALGRPRTLPPATAAARPAMPPGGPLAGNPFWPPPALTLPDNLLGERVRTRFVTGNAPVRGTRAAPVEVLYFTPLGHKQARQLLEGLLETYRADVRVVAKVIPLPSGETVAAEAAMFAHDNDRFWPFHDAFRGHELNLPDRATVETVAARAGLDRTALAAALDDGRYRDAVLAEATEQRAARIGQAARFAFVVDGRRLESAAAIAQAVDAVLRKAGRRAPARAARELAVSPTDPKYDAQAWQSYLSAEQFFLREARDEAWATAMEKELGPLLARDLRGVEPSVGALRFDCRATTCRLRWPAGRADATIKNAASYLYARGPQPRGGPGETYLILRRNAQSSTAATLTSVHARRDTLVFVHRTGRPVQPPPFPVDRMPRK